MGMMVAIVVYDEGKMGKMVVDEGKNENDCGV